MVKNRQINLNKSMNRREQRKTIYQTKLNLTAEERTQRKKDFLRFLNERQKIEVKEKVKNPRFRFVESETKELGYSKLAKQIIRETPGLLREFYRVSKERLREYKDPEGRFEIERHLMLPSVRTTNVAYVLSVKHNGKTRKFFIKETNNSGILERTSGNNKTTSFLDYVNRGIDGISEARALSLIQDCGIQIITHHFAFKDLERKKSYIVYDFVPELLNGIHLKKLISRKQVPISKIQEIKEYIKDAKDKIYQELKNKKKYGIDDNRIITDILDFDNIYYDSKKDKVFLFDPLLENTEYVRKI